MGCANPAADQGLSNFGVDEVLMRSDQTRGRTPNSLALATACVLLFASSFS
jgi:hypothetical protein